MHAVQADAVTDQVDVPRHTTGVNIKPDCLTTGALAAHHHSWIHMRSATWCRRGQCCDVGAGGWHGHRRYLGPPAVLGRVSAKILLLLLCMIKSLTICVCWAAARCSCGACVATAGPAAAAAGSTPSTAAPKHLCMQHCADLMSGRTIIYFICHNKNHNK